MEIASSIIKLVGTLALTATFNKFLSTFRIRQLYLSFETVLQCHDSNVKGYTTTLSIFNKGKDKEKTVEIIIPKTKNCLILSSDYPSINCEENIITIDRILPKQIINISIYIESDELISKNNKPKIKSEDANGKAYGSRSEVPASMGPSVLSASICLSLIALMLYIVWTDKDPFNTFYALKYSDFVDQGLIPSAAGDNYMISKGDSGSRLIEVLPVSTSKSKLVFSYRIKNPTVKPIYVTILSSAAMDYYRETSKISKTEAKEVSEKKLAEIDLHYWIESEYDPDSNVRDAVILPGQSNILAIKKSKIVGADPNKLEITVVIEGETERGDTFKDYYKVTPAKSKAAKSFLDLLK